jgi:glycosyltransferase involved in cell wall biosynthesis
MSGANILRTGFAGAVPWSRERDLLNFLRAHNVKVILAEFGPSGCALRHFCKRHGIDLFVNFHGYDATVMPRRLTIRHAYRSLALDAAGFICGSQYFKRILVNLGFPADRVHVVPCGIECEHFAPSPTRDANLLIAVGRLTAKKRADLTIRAFALARDQMPRLRLEIIGDGPLFPHCEALIGQLGLSECVTLLGERDHDFVRRRLAEASIFVQHSMTAPNNDQESQGISLLEAMAAGIPVVTTDHNGFSEAVVHGSTGLLSPEGDFQAMASNILLLAASDQMRREFGRRGRARVEAHFDAERTSERLRAVLFDRPAETAPLPGSADGDRA